MAVPKKKTSVSKRGTRRSHDAIKAPEYSFNKETGEVQRSHRVSVDGYYKGKKVDLKPKFKKDSQKPQSNTKPDSGATSVSDDLEKKDLKVVSQSNKTDKKTKVANKSLEKDKS